MIPGTTELTERCPACNNTLLSQRHGKEVAVFCAVGVCPSVEANNGAAAATAEEAVRLLDLKVEAEMERWVS